MKRQSIHAVPNVTRATIAIVVLGVLASGVALSRSGGGSDGDEPQRREADSQPTTKSSQPAKQPKIIPWIEVNIGTKEEVASAVAGLKIWKEITDTAIVTTAPDHFDVYERICPAVPEMKIIPGVKTADLVKPFDSLEGWKKAAEQVKRMCALTREKRFVLENETALYDHHDESRNYWAGKMPVDYERLKLGLKELPKDVEIWFYPSFGTGTERKIYHRQSELLCQAVQDVLDTRFVDFEFAKPPERNEWWHADLAKLRDRIAKKPSIPIVYFWSNDKFWQYEDAKRVLSLVHGDDVIFYPAADRWSKCAEQMRDRLRR